MAITPTAHSASTQQEDYTVYKDVKLGITFSMPANVLAQHMGNAACPSGYKTPTSPLAVYNEQNIIYITQKNAVQKLEKNDCKLTPVTINQIRAQDGDIFKITVANNLKKEDVPNFFNTSLNWKCTLKEFPRKLKSNPSQPVIDFTVDPNNTSEECQPDHAVTLRYFVDLKKAVLTEGGDDCLFVNDKRDQNGNIIADKCLESEIVSSLDILTP